MRRRFQFTRPSRRTMIIAAIVLGSLLIYGLTQISYQCDWTGFGVCDFVAGSDEDYRPEKTLWDWLGLLIIPTVLAGGAIYFNQAERQNELKLAEQRTRTEYEIADDRLREEALQAYLDRMSELLIEHRLRTSDPDTEVRSVARARTLTVLRRLDGGRRVAVLQFLYESDLISGDASVIPLLQADLTNVDLQLTNLTEANLAGANLLGAKLRQVFLYGANLRGANLTRANLQGAVLTRAKLMGANLQGADLQGAKLNEADLRGAKLMDAHLQGVNLQGANLYLAKLMEVNLQGADLPGAIFPGVDLRRANLQGANLQGANLQYAKLTEANLTRANLTRANLQGTDLQAAILEGTILEGANLARAKVTSEQLAQAASLTGAIMPDGSIHP